MGKRGRMPANKLPIDVGPMETSSKSTKEDIERQRRYRAEDALNTLTRACEIEKDKNLMKDVKSLKNERMKSLKEIG